MDKLSRKEARFRGLSRYFTGSRCVAGHISERSVGNGECLACKKERKKERNQTPEGKVSKASCDARHYSKNKEGIKQRVTQRIKNNRAHVNAQQRGYARARRLRMSDQEKSQQKDRAKNRRLRYRHEVITHYGGKCTCCGESDIRFLCIDHVNGGGSAHRKVVKASALYRWLIKNGFPEGFQVLCWSCNSAKHIYGVCPHQEEKP